MKRRNFIGTTLAGIGALLIPTGGSVADPEPTENAWEREVTQDMVDMGSKRKGRVLHGGRKVEFYTITRGNR